MLEEQPPAGDTQVLRVFLCGVAGCALTLLLFAVFPIVPAFIAIAGATLTGGNVHTGSPVLFVLVVPLLTVGFALVFFKLVRRH